MQHVLRGGKSMHTVLIIAKLVWCSAAVCSALYVMLIGSCQTMLKCVLANVLPDGVQQKNGADASC